VPISRFTICEYLLRMSLLLAVAQALTLQERIGHEKESIVVPRASIRLWMMR
jgi:hypothetical protein